MDTQPQSQAGEGIDSSDRIVPQLGGDTSAEEVPPFQPPKRKRSRNKYIIGVDLFGAAAAIATIAYYFSAHQNPAHNEELYTLWANICTEAVGIYLSVRILEFLVRNTQERRTARVGLVRNSRFMLKLARTAAYHITPLNIASIEHEMDYTRYIFARRERFLTEDERQCLTDFYGAVEQHVDLLKSVHTRAVRGGSVEREDAERIWTSVDGLAATRWTAEQNIFEETAED